MPRSSPEIGRVFLLAMLALVAIGLALGQHLTTLIHGSLLCFSCIGIQ